MELIFEAKNYSKCFYIVSLPASQIFCQKFGFQNLPCTQIFTIRMEKNFDNLLKAKILFRFLVFIISSISSMIEIFL